MGKRLWAGRLKISLLLGILGTLGALGTKKGIQSLTAIERYTLYVDTSLDPIIHTELRDFLTTLHATNKYLTVHEACLALSATFPYVKTAEGHLYAPHTVHYQITAKQPFIKINESHVLAPDNTLLPPHLFHASALDALPTIATAEPLDGVTHAPESLATLAHSLAPAIFQMYIVTWHNRFLTTLQSNQHKNEIIICTADLPPNEAIIAQCTQIFSTLESTSMRKGRLVADVRFANQIIIQAEQGGTAHG